MLNQPKKLRAKTKIDISLALIMVLLLGCASHRKADVRALRLTCITNMIIRKTPESLVLTIEGDRALTYTVEKLVFPMGIVLQFPDTSIELPGRIYWPPENDIVSSVKAVEKIENQATTAHIFVAFKKDASYELSSDAGRVTVSFPAADASSKNAQPRSEFVENKPESEKKPEPAIIQSSPPAANQLKKITATALEDKITVEVIADSAINNYKSFTLDHPPRIVFDLYNLKSPYTTEQTISLASPWIERIRHFAHPDRVRLVLETHNSYLSKYSALPTSTGMLIQVGNAYAAPNKEGQIASDTALGTREVKLAWEGVPNATGYNIYWSTFPGVTKHNGNKISNVQSPAVINHLRPGVTYYFVVTAIAGSKEGPESEEFSYTPGE